MKTLFIILAIVVLAIINPVTATINVTPHEIGPTYIIWTWPAGTPLVNMSVDGIIVYTFDPNQNTFILSELPQNESHTISVYSITDSGTNTTRTSVVPSAQEQLYSNIDRWIYVLLAIVMFIAGATVYHLFFFIGSGISLYALVTYVQDHGPITADIWHIQFMIYACLFVMGFVLWAIRHKKRR